MCKVNDVQRMLLRRMEQSNKKRKMINSLIDQTDEKQWNKNII